MWFTAFACALLGAVPARAAMSQGEYLTRAADCEACHTMPGGTAFAGGRAFKLPFGTIYSPNITPDPVTGIGDYTDDEFVSALQRGVGHGGKYLYPVMPYNSYTLMSRADALAIKSYLFSLKPVSARAPANKLGFPFNQRWTLWFWNQANNPAHRFQPDGARSAAWNRGAYLVQALGHCGQCHTPRNWMQGLASGRAYSGAKQAGWVAYNITSDKVFGIGGWTDDALKQYLSTGHAPGHGPASGPMAEAVSDSLRYMTPEDIAAIVTYLRDIPAQTGGPQVVASPPPAVANRNPLGEHVFAAACEGCHLPNGQGRQSTWAALAGDRSAGDPNGTNMLQVLAHGSELTAPDRHVFMHAFTGAFTDAELAAVADYVTRDVAGRQSSVTAADIARARAD
ncbi:MAG TPA: cytochrome c [Acetobacteraceae bacterium]|nr:cytochrome c [Acetobacteraceae bacterium]